MSWGSCCSPSDATGAAPLYDADVLSGPYGLVEQAINRLARLVEWRQHHPLFW